MVTMDHATATLTGAAERYVLREMSEQERDTYEVHFFSCPHCADEVSAAARFVENATPLLRAEPQTPPVRHRSSVDATALTRWRAVLGLVQPLPFAAAAAGLVLVTVVGYQTLVLVPGLRDQLHEIDALQVAPSYFLSVSRGDAPVVAVEPGQRYVSLALSRDPEHAFPFYRCDLQDAAGRTVLSATLPAPRSGDELQILLPTRTLQSGSYVMVVAGLESASTPVASDSARHPFTLDRRNAAR